MLTIQKYLKAFNEMGVSQEKMAEYFCTSKGSINNWISGKTKKIRTEAPLKLYDGAENYRTDNGILLSEDEFIEQLIKYIDITDREKNLLRAQYRKNGYQETLNKIIYWSIKCVDFVPAAFEYDPKNSLRPVIGVGQDHVLAVTDQGRVYSSGLDDSQQCQTSAWNDIVSVVGSWKGSIGLKSDGSCIAIGRNLVGDGSLFRWKDISSIASGPFHVLGLRTDGTVIPFGKGGAGQCQVSRWKNVAGIATGFNHSVALMEDGHVEAVGKNHYGQCNVKDWSDVVQIAASGDHTLGLTRDGKVLSTGDVELFHFEDWETITAIATGNYHAAGLLPDGTVINTGFEHGGLNDVERWHDIIAISADYGTTAGVRADGKVFVTHDPHKHFCLDTYGWKLFENPYSELKISAFLAMLERYEEALRKIKERTMKLAPFVTQFMDHFHDDLLSPDDSIFQENYEMLYLLSKETWGMHFECKGLPTLDRIITEYNLAFISFKNTILNENNLFRLTENSPKAYQELLMTINKQQIELRILAEDS